jgi:pimeloyl-ACP methyl ester carboxylesterase
MTDLQFLTLPDKRKLSFVEYGDKKGRPVFYFHGTPSSCFEPLLIGDEALTRYNIRLIAASRPGMGHSDYKKNRTFIDWTNDTISLADYLGIDKFAILGYSGGTGYALACAAKISGRLTSIVIVSGAGQMNMPEAKKNLKLSSRIFWTIADKYPFILPVVLRKIKKSLNTPREDALEHAQNYMPNADYEALKQGDRLESSQRALTEAVYNLKGVARDMQLLVRPRGFDLDEIIRLPVTFFHGEEDKTVPVEVVRQMAPLITNAKLVTYKNDGHLSVLCDHFDEIAEILLNKIHG